MPKTNERKRQSRAEMIKHLEDFIAHPETGEKERESAREKLATLQTQKREREEHTEKVRERAREDMSTAEGMRRVVEFMRNSPGFAKHSPNNIALLLADADMRGMTLTSVRKLSEWRSMGYKVVKGSKAFVQWVPMRPKEDDEDQRMRFRLVAAWFDRSQVEPMKKSAEPTPDPEQAAAGPWALPAEPESGDRHAWLWLRAQAEREGFAVRLTLDVVGVPAAVTFHEAEKRIEVTIPPGSEGFPDYRAVLDELAAILFNRIRDRDTKREAKAPTGAGASGKKDSAKPKGPGKFVMNW